MWTKRWGVLDWEEDTKADLLVTYDKSSVVMSVYVWVCGCVYALLVNYDHVNYQSLQIIFMCFLE